MRVVSTSAVGPAILCFPSLMKYTKTIESIARPPQLEILKIYNICLSVYYSYTYLLHGFLRPKITAAEQQQMCLSYPQQKIDPIYSTYLSYILNRYCGNDAMMQCFRGCTLMFHCSKPHILKSHCKNAAI